MLTGWNIVSTTVIALLCGQSIGFWPFDVYAAAASDPADPNPSTKRVAVIGAGAAGSSTAYYLQKFASRSGIDIDVTVYDRAPHVGGRSTTVNAYNDPLYPVELGASIFVEVNTILKNSSEAFNLTPTSLEGDDTQTLGIWNGEIFVYTQNESGWAWLDLVKLVWKYGLAPIRTQRLMKSTVSKFRKLYEYPFFPFRSLSDRAFDLDLTSITSMTGEQLLTANNIGAPFTTDIIQASTRVNYGQNLNLIHGLEAMVCMAIDGAMSIEGGNWQIFDGMLRASNATVLLNSTVNEITKRNGRYNIKTSTRDNFSGKIQITEEPFDSIVLAAPLQYSGITIEKDLLKHTPSEIPYVTLHVTLFTSPYTLNPTYFNLAPDAKAPTTILTTLRPGEVPPNREDGVGSTGFFSISTLRTVINTKTLEEEHLYKIFSPREITSQFLSGILNSTIPSNLSSINIDSDDAITWYYPHVWHSYPYEYPRVTFEDPELAKGFYYTSGIESFISTMETSALMGMNVAQLIVDDYVELIEQQGKKIDSPLQILLSEKAKDMGVEEL